MKVWTEEEAHQAEADGNPTAMRQFRTQKYLQLDDEK